MERFSVTVEQFGQDVCDGRPIQETSSTPCWHSAAFAKTALLLIQGSFIYHPAEFLYPTLEKLLLWCGDEPCYTSRGNRWSRGIRGMSGHPPRVSQHKSFLCPSALSTNDLLSRLIWTYLNCVQGLWMEAVMNAHVAECLKERRIGGWVGSGRRGRAVERWVTGKTLRSMWRWWWAVLVSEKLGRAPTVKNLKGDLGWLNSLLILVLWC